LTTVIDNIRVTTVAQTLFDLVPRITLDRLERAIDFHLLRKSVTVQNLIERRVSLDSSRRPGIAIWRALVDERSAHAWVPPESDLESDLWAVLRDLPGEPGLERQATMPWWQPGEGRVDVLAVNWRTIYEADGRAWHARVRDFDADRWRDNMAQANGYRVLRFTHTHLRQRPDEARTIAIQTGRWRVAAA
jgi:very-short-patch-repair endonuclease